MKALGKYSRKNNLLISGILYEKDKQIRAIVLKIAKELEITLKDYDIYKAHGLLTKNKTPDIIVRVWCNGTKK